MDERSNNNSNNGQVENPWKEDFTLPTNTSHEEWPRRRRFPWAWLAVVLLVFGVGLYVVVPLTGVRGDSTTMEPDPFHSIDITANSTRVIIMPGDSYKVALPRRMAFTADVENGVLSISARPQIRSVRFLIFNFSGTVRDEIRVYVPRNSHKISDIQVSTSSGRIQIDGVNVRDIRARSSSGRIQLSNISTHMSRVNLTSSSGRINLENIQMATDLSLQASSGRIQLDSVSWGELSARASSGRIEINRGGENGGAGPVTLQTSSGSVALEIVGNSNSYRYELSTSSGSMRVDNNRFIGRNHSGGGGADRIRISTSSGSIRLNFVR